MLALGTRLGGLATNGWRMPARGATVLQIDRDPYGVRESVCAVARHVRRPRSRAARHRGCSARASATPRPATGSRIAGPALRAGERSSLRHTHAVGNASPLSPLTVIACARAAMPARPPSWPTPATWPHGRACCRRCGGRTRTSAPRARSGWALPASLGVQLARTGEGRVHHRRRRRRLSSCRHRDGGALSPAGRHPRAQQRLPRLRVSRAEISLARRCGGRGQRFHAAWTMPGPRTGSARKASACETRDGAGVGARGSRWTRPGRT